MPSRLLDPHIDLDMLIKTWPRRKVVARLRQWADEMMKLMPAGQNGEPAESCPDPMSWAGHLYDRANELEATARRTSRPEGVAPRGGNG